MSELPVYSADTSALIDGLERYYPEASFPGVWQAIDDLIDAGRFRASEEVWEEVKKKDEVVKAWFEPRRDRLILPTSQAVLESTREILSLHPRISMAGSGRNRADPFVIAAARVLGGTVVTGEGHDGSAKRPKIPFICQDLQVRCIRFTDLIGAEGWSFYRS